MDTSSLLRSGFSCWEVCLFVCYTLCLSLGSRRIGSSSRIPKEPMWCSLGVDGARALVKMPRQLSVCRLAPCSQLGRLSPPERVLRHAGAGLLCLTGC